MDETEQDGIRNKDPFPGHPQGNAPPIPRMSGISIQGVSLFESTGPFFHQIQVPQRSLLVLCGIAGCGKSTFAQTLVETHREQGLQATSIVSSDYCRALVCDDETNQQVSRDSFDLFYYIIHKRMFQNRFTIADSTALQAEARRRMLAVAQRHHYATCLLIFNIAPTICIQRDALRVRSVGEQVIAYQNGLLQQALLAIPTEGWSKVYVLNEQSLPTCIEILQN